MPHEKKLFAVVCTNLHFSQGPFPTSEMAQRWADELNLRSATRERDDPNYRGCRYQVIDMFVMIDDDGLVKALKPAGEPEKKVRLH